MSTLTAVDVSFSAQSGLSPFAKRARSFRDYLFEGRLSPLLRERGLSRVDHLIRTLRVCSDPMLERRLPKPWQSRRPACSATAQHSSFSARNFCPP
jgi:hypothetical protein